MRVSAVAGLVFVFALTGCASAEEPGGSVDDLERAEPVLTQPLEPLTSPEVLEFCPQEDAVHFDGVVDTIDNVYECSVEVSADGTRVERVERVTNWADELLTLYSEPNEYATADACIQLAPDPLIVWVHKDDEVTPYYAPVDECGFPNEIVQDAYETAEFETVLEVEVTGTGEED